MARRHIPQLPLYSTGGQTDNVLIMILQIIFDDKFGDYAIGQFAPYRDVTKIVLVKEPSEQIRYVKRLSEIEIAVHGEESYSRLIESVGTYQAVIMHGLFSPMQYEIIEHMPASAKLAWVMWGAEIYAREKEFSSNLAPISKILYHVRSLKDWFISPQKVQNDPPLDIIQRVDYLLGSSLEIYEDVRSKIRNSSLRHLQYSYFTLEDLIGKELLEQHVCGKDVLIGNSANIENNHLDLFFRLRLLHISSDSKVIVPLSYGSIWVKRLISRCGLILFRKQFVPIMEFLPRAEYNKLVLSSSVYISNHYRPNAFGNTLTALWLGARVYVSENSIQTRFLLNMGIPVGIIERDLVPSNPIWMKPMGQKELILCRSIISSRYSAERMNVNIKNIIVELNS